MHTLHSHELPQSHATAAVEGEEVHNEKTCTYLCASELVRAWPARACVSHLECVCVCDSVFVLVTLWGVAGDSFFLLSASEG